MIAEGAGKVRMVDAGELGGGCSKAHVQLGQGTVCLEDKQHLALACA